MASWHILRALRRRDAGRSLAAEVSNAATVMEEADFMRALLAEAIHQDFQLKSWINVVSKWKQILAMDSRTGYDLLNGQTLGEDKRPSTSLP